MLRKYMSRWRIEEYFRFKKTEFNFEDFRLRKLVAIHPLNSLLTYTLGFFAVFFEKKGKSPLTHLIIEYSKSIRTKLLFYFYPLARGGWEILVNTRIGISEWYQIRRNEHCRQLAFQWVC